MRLPQSISSLWSDPPPRFVFELSEDGVAFAKGGGPPQILFQPLERDVISVSPVKDNVLRMEELTARVKSLAGAEKKRRRAVLILPDFAVRVSVLDFDAFPEDAAQQDPLVRFRVKKSLPFDLDSAKLTYEAHKNGKGWDVVAVAASLEILARYEAPFRAAGLEPGVVTSSTLASLPLLRGEGVAVLAKLSGANLTLAVVRQGALKLLRSITLETGGAAELLSHLYPTFAYIEDCLNARAERVLTCGLGREADELRDELGGRPEVEPLRSRFSTPHHYNAGLLGFLESTEGFFQ
jgi:type IV pilus assembly protein PilM